MMSGLLFGRQQRDQIGRRKRQRDDARPQAVRVSRFSAIALRPAR